MGTATTPSTALPAGVVSVGRALSLQSPDAIGPGKPTSPQGRTTARTNAMGRIEFAASLPCTRSSVRCARTLVLKALNEWAVNDDLVHTGETVVSELMTNVVEHTATAHCEVTVELDEHESIRITVSDSSREAPYVRAPADEEERGRGLRLIAAMSQRWGYDFHPWGKVTWAVLSAA
ncbi:ATP-binding protein [Streptomyces anulatus]|uniref:ATP-binding protein n=1 Tax=Streptomyces anulatus TaxID=1892 RepID=UPI002F907B56